MSMWRLRICPMLQPEKINGVVFFVKIPFQVRKPDELKLFFSKEKLIFSRCSDLLHRGFLCPRHGQKNEKMLRFSLKNASIFFCLFFFLR